MSRARDKRKAAAKDKKKRKTERLWFKGSQLVLAFDRIREFAPHANPGDAFILVMVENEQGQWGWAFESNVRLDSHNNYMAEKEEADGKLPVQTGK